MSTTLRCRPPMFFEYVWRDQAYGKCNPKWDENNVIQISEYGNKVWYQVDRAKRVSGHARCDDLCVPGDTRVLSRT